ncbi:unnamed protein product [Didymodactylos carnosus]|uniref:DDE Tnp4 domain-containing protein n=1 Tax=Didymodactylos carnosus TaxID=1234261 RepID=A0A8S2EW70_9BILA|nr:unnamed protein product [Didymodactylos carnosus]CAF4136466.1 unnamed protein product [Didymodactylos carnosus]
MYIGGGSDILMNNGIIASSLSRSGRYCGSYHDAKLFTQAKVAEQCTVPEGSWLLGDRGFTNKPPVLTPFRRFSKFHKALENAFFDECERQ